MSIYALCAMDICQCNVEIDVVGWRVGVCLKGEHEVWIIGCNDINVEIGLIFDIPPQNQRGGMSEFCVSLIVM